MSDNIGIWDLYVIRRGRDSAYLAHDGSYGALERAAIYVSLLEANVAADAALQVNLDDAPISCITLFGEIRRHILSDRPEEQDVDCVINACPPSPSP